MAQFWFSFGSGLVQFWLRLASSFGNIDMHILSFGSVLAQLWLSFGSSFGIIDILVIKSFESFVVVRCSSFESVVCFLLSFVVVGEKTCSMLGEQ